MNSVNQEVLSNIVSRTNRESCITISAKELKSVGGNKRLGQQWLQEVEELFAKESIHFGSPRPNLEEDFVILFNNSFRAALKQIVELEAKLNSRSLKLVGVVGVPFDAEVKKLAKAANAFSAQCK